MNISFLFKKKLILIRSYRKYGKLTLYYYNFNKDKVIELVNKKYDSIRG